MRAVPYGAVVKRKKESTGRGMPECFLYVMGNNCVCVILCIFSFLFIALCGMIDTGILFDKIVVVMIDYERENHRWEGRHFWADFIWMTARI